MARIGKIVNNFIQENDREITIEEYTNYTTQANQTTPSGIDSSPINDKQGIIIKIDGSSGKFVNIGILPDATVDQGEIKIFSENSEGIQAEIYLKNDGTIKINNGTDFAVRFTELETAFNQLKQDFDLHVHPGVLSGGASTGVTTPSTADISTAKIEEINLPGV